MTAQLRTVFQQLADEAQEYDVVAAALAIEERRRSRFVAAASGLVVLALLFTATLGYGQLHSSALQPAKERGTPSLPNRLADASILTASVSADPPGRVSAVVQNHGVPDWFASFRSASNEFFVGADQDVYRTVNEPFGAHPYYMNVLSPDGTSAVLAAEDIGIARIDLRTGKTQRYMSAGMRETPRLYGVSPDGRYLAWSPELMGKSYAITRGLQLLDLTTGKSVEVISAERQVEMVAFSPDGRRLAVDAPSTDPVEWWNRDAKNEIFVVDGSGRELARIPVKGALSGPNAWSPDGKLLATQEIGFDRAGTAATRWPDSKLRFYAVDGALAASKQEAAVQSEVRLRMQGQGVVGWRSASEVALMEPSGEGAALTVRSVEGGDRRVLSTLPFEGRVIVAAGLLPELAARPAGEPDHGPLPTWVVLTGFGFMLVAALVAVPVLLRRRRPGPAIVVEMG